MNFRLLFNPFGLFAFLALAVSHSSASASQYEAIAAKYRTTACSLPCEKSQSGEWYLWRADNRVEIRSGSGQIGEIWRRDNKGGVSFVYVEPNHKRGIEYTDTDVKLLGTTRAWEKLASVISPAELARLSLQEKQKSLAARHSDLQDSWTRARLK